MPRWYDNREAPRPAYYDRNTVSQLLSFSATVGPHANTQRASYAPPFPYAAFVEALYFGISRQTAASSVGEATAYLEYRPFNGGFAYLFTTTLLNNTPLANTQRSEGQFGYLAYGDIFRIYTYDLSTGGTNAFVTHVKFCEFDY